MKALIFKELRLSMHPICYVFIALFPLMLLIPNYPIAISFLYVLTAYPILFLGANKGQQSNDLLFSVLLPVRKKDIVLARIITVTGMQVVFILLNAALLPLAFFIKQTVLTLDPSLATPEVPGIGLEGFVSVLAIVIVGYSIADLIYFSIYYKNGRSIVLSTLLMILGFVVYICVFTIIFPYLPGFEGYLYFLTDMGLHIQFILLIASIIISVLLHYLTYKVASKKLEKVDF